MVEADELTIGGTLIWYYAICHREVWFLSRRIVPDQQDDNLQIGRLVHAQSYTRQRKEVLIDNAIKIDVTTNEGLIAEVKKSGRSLDAARLQLAYYLWYLKQNKKVETTGVLLIPAEKRRMEVRLTPELGAEIEQAVAGVRRIAGMLQPPPLKRIPFCAHCAYAPICWV